MTQKTSLIFMGDFTYPGGMASTRRIQNLINALKESADIESIVIVQRQPRQGAARSGVFEGTHYAILMEDVFKIRMILSLPILYYKTITALRRAWKPGKRNVLYFYGPIFIDSIVPLYYARRLGYKIVFDVVEDFGLAKDVSRSFYQYIRSSLADRISSQIRRLASGIIVISSYLEQQARSLAKGKIPMHYMPISVDMGFFPESGDGDKSIKTFFYAGSFGKKDGVPVLIDAFDALAGTHDDIRLVLTGRGDDMAMTEFFSRVERSPYKDRIEYKGYLSDMDYYSLLNDIDIPCMTRVDLAFAQAGFPFKLGEYLATGKPVIASRVSDVERFLENGDNAMLVEAGSSEEICRAAEILLSDPELARTIGERGRKVACSFFDNIRQGRNFLAFLEQVYKAN